MAKERIREVLTISLSPEYIALRAQEGWRPVAVEWEREAGPELTFEAELVEEIPYGLQVSADCQRLEENPLERLVLVQILEQIVQDAPISVIAKQLNLNGHRTRRGSKWTPVSVFNILPRLIEVGPRILSTHEWAERRERVLKAM